MANFPPTVLETEASFRSQERKRHATLRKSRLGANGGFEVQWNSNLTEGNQKAMASFPSTALETEASYRSQERENQATF